MGQGGVPLITGCGTVVIFRHNGLGGFEGFLYEGFREI